jgi:hypothetical protein
MHIEDYDRPLAVTWVCEACRRLHDHGPDREGEDPIGALLRRFDQRREGPSTLRKTQGRPRRVA